LAHPFTAASPKAARGNQTVMFYIEDPNETIKDAESDAEVQDKSAALYQQIKDDDRKIKAVINLLQHYVPKKPGEMFIPDLLTSEQRKLEVRKLAMGKYYRQFYATATDPDVFNRYQLFELIRLNLLKRAGTSILVGESNEVLGGNEKEALDNLYHNTANAQLLENLKAQAKDKIQKAALGK
jgi:predicted solute-binding protein